MFGVAASVFLAAFTLSTTAAESTERPNVLLISVDDLRPQFGRTTRVGVGIGGWCWCQRSKCVQKNLFMTLPTYMRQHGYTTAGNGKLFHPDACRNFGFAHSSGDDPRASSYFTYFAEANVTQEQWGAIPGPRDPVFNRTMGLSWMESPLEDEEETDGILATNAVQRFANFSRDGIGKKGANRPFFHSVGFHKPHLPHIVPKKYFDLYDLKKCQLAAEPKCAERLQRGTLACKWQLRDGALQSKYWARVSQGRLQFSSSHQ